MLYKRNETWWVRFTVPNGTRIRRSAKTINKAQAQEFHDRLKAKLWRSHNLDEKTDHFWQEAVIRWLNETKHKAVTLLAFLPEHLEATARFSLLTGLRKSNVTGLKWSQVDLDQAVAWIHTDQAKAGHSIHVPLNKDALEVLQNQKGKHDEHVFTYRSKPIQQVNTKAWRKSLQKANITDFRWHDLLHTWASWHVQQGTPLALLQELGGWESAEMVRRYAHLGNEHTSSFANQLSLQEEDVPQNEKFWHKSSTNEDLDIDLSALSH